MSDDLVDSWLYDPVVAFGDLTSKQAETARSVIADSALESARLLAAEHLLAGPIKGFVDDAQQVADALRDRATSTPRYELLQAFEKPWALLVLKLVASVVSDPASAVREARDRGAGVPEIAVALGLTEAAVYKRFSAEVVRRTRRK
jgi:hypothetical protein